MSHPDADDRQPHAIFGNGEPVPRSYFAPARRASQEEIEQSIAVVTENPLFAALAEATDVSVVVLNRERQILVANSVLLKSLGSATEELLAGLRLGEAVGCVNAWHEPGGCGTSPACATCGAVLAILESQSKGTTVERECLMTVRHGSDLEGYELHVKASQVEIAGEVFTVVGLRDVSAEKRREFLERVFLHDISNTLSPLLLSAQLLAQRAPESMGKTARRVATLAERLKRDIDDQRVLLHAEAGTLQPRSAPVELEKVLDGAGSMLRDHPVARGREIVVAPAPEPLPRIETDESLLVRVLVNMLKNALEATPEGGQVRTWVRPADEAFELCVWNAGPLDPKVALQIFRRSFSTKPGPGRGLGTFSMKLFGERYLGGTVDFTSNDADGTTFFIRLPARR